MGIPVLILGASGSGKSASLRNFTPEQISVFNVASKPFPFRGKLPKVDGSKYENIKELLKRGGKKAYAIDDSQFLMVFEEFDRAKESGYGKFTDMALNFYSLVQTVIKDLPADVIVYFLHHTEVDEFGKTKAKTVGKMIDSKLTLEGMFSIVLLAGTDGNEHWFDSQSDGYTTAKSPIGMFPMKRFDNDLQLVDMTIRDYWGLAPNEAPVDNKKKEGK